MDRLELVQSTNLAAWRSFTYPSYASRLLDADQNLVGLALHKGGIAVGFALASLRPDEPLIADLLSINVIPGYRRMGAATTLLQHLEPAVAARGAKALVAVYMTGRPNSEAVAGLLHRSGWSEGERRMLFCESDWDTIIQAPWMARREFAEPFEPFFWATLSNAERQDILDRQARAPWFPETLTPFWMEHTIEPVSSLGLRYKGEIVGWCISHRVDRETIRFARLFVSQQFQGIARAVPLLARSIYCHENTEVRRAIFDVAAHNAPMLRFVERRLQPYLLKTYWTLQSRKLLSKTS